MNEASCSHIKCCVVTPSYRPCGFSPAVRGYWKCRCLGPVFSHCCPVLLARLNISISESHSCPSGEATASEYTKWCLVSGLHYTSVLCNALPIFPRTLSLRTFFDKHTSTVSDDNLHHRFSFQRKPPSYTEPSVIFFF